MDVNMNDNAPHLDDPDDPDDPDGRDELDRLHNLSALAELDELISDQTRDTFAHTALGSGVRARLLYVRCQEARTQQLTGQDFARVAARQSDGRIAFCVCDGVSSSFRGDFAARYLGANLVDWLLALPDDRAPMSNVAASLSDKLTYWANVAQQELLRQELPASTSPLVREVLQELRLSHGSEAVFLAGLIEPALANDRPRILLCWMGNVTARLLPDVGRDLSVDLFRDDRNRWSTARGFRGQLSVRGLTLPSLAGLLVYTDGLSAIGSILPDADDEQLQAAVLAQLEQPENDDMTLLDLRWGATHPQLD